MCERGILSTHRWSILKYHWSSDDFALFLQSFHSVLFSVVLATYCITGRRRTSASSTLLWSLCMCRIKEKSISQLDPLVFIDFVSSLTNWYMTVLSWIHHYLLYYLTSYLRDTTVFEFKLMVVPPSLYNGVACTLPSQKVLKRNHFGVFHFNSFFQLFCKCQVPGARCHGASLANSFFQFFCKCQVPRCQAS